MSGHKYTPPALVGDGSTRIPQYAEIGVFLSLQSIINHMEKRLADCEQELLRMRMNQDGAP